MGYKTPYYEVSFTAPLEYVVSWIVSSDHMISDPQGGRTLEPINVRPLSISPYRLRFFISIVISDKVGLSKFESVVSWIVSRDHMISDPQEMTLEPIDVRPLYLHA